MFWKSNNLLPLLFTALPDSASLDYESFNKSNNEPGIKAVF